MCCYITASRTNTLRVGADVGIPGDRVSLISPAATFELNMLLEFDYKILTDKTNEFNPSQLFVLQYSLLGYPEEQFDFHPKTDGMWHTAQVCFPSGKYHVMFIAQLGIYQHSDVSLDNVKQSPSNCALMDSLEKGLPLHNTL